MSIDQLIYAIEQQDYLQIKSLLINDSELVNQSRQGRDYKPLHRAASLDGSSHAIAKIISLLIESGADVNALSDKGESPLHYAIKQDRLEPVMQLISGGADIDLRNGEGESPLEICVRSRLYSCIGFLLSLGAKIDIHVAVIFGRIDWVRWIFCEEPNLLDDLHSSDELLCDAISINNLDIINILIDNGCAVNSELGTITPLWRSIERGEIEIVRKLLEAGADPNGCRPQESFPDWQYPGWSSPLELARERGLAEIEALLKSYGATE